VKKLYSLLLKSYLGPFFLTFFIALFIFLLQFIWKYIDDLVGKGLDFSVIAELLFYSTVNLIPMSLPMAILLSSIMLFGNMGENNELLAFKSAGVPLLKIMSPLIVLIVMISIGAFFFSNHVMPYSSLKMRSLIKDIQDTRPELSLKSGAFISTLKDFSIKVSSKNKETQMLYDMMIYDHSGAGGNRIVNLADSGKMYMSPNKTHMILELFHGSRYEEVEEPATSHFNKTVPFERHYFDKEVMLFSMEGFGLKRNDESLWKDHFQMMNLEQLEFTIDSLSERLDSREKSIKTDLLFNNYFRREVKADSLMYTSNDYIPLDTDSLFNSLSKAHQLNSVDLAMNFARSVKNYVFNTDFDLTSRFEWLIRYKIEWHRKYTLSIACLILFFIGAPLGAIIRKGGLGMPVVVSIIFFLLYYVISITGEKVAREGDITAMEGMWISSVILFPIGFFLTYKASRDSVILNIASYTAVFKKIFSKASAILKGKK
jgi:lipopolysaccharide export system permease protein